MVDSGCLDVVFPKHFCDANGLQYDTKAPRMRHAMGESSAVGYLTSELHFKLLAGTPHEAAVVVGGDCAPVIVIDTPADGDNAFGALIGSSIHHALAAQLDFYSATYSARTELHTTGNDDFTVSLDLRRGPRPVAATFAHTLAAYPGDPCRADGWLRATRNAERREQLPTRRGLWAMAKEPLPPHGSAAQTAGEGAAAVEGSQTLPRDSAVQAAGEGPAEWADDTAQDHNVGPSSTGEAEASARQQEPFDTRFDTCRTAVLDWAEVDSTHPDDTPRPLTKEATALLELLDESLEEYDVSVTSLSVPAWCDLLLFRPYMIPDGVRGIAMLEADGPDLFGPSRWPALQHLLSDPEAMVSTLTPSIPFMTGHQAFTAQLLINGVRYTALHRPVAVAVYHLRSLRSTSFLTLHSFYRRSCPCWICSGRVGWCSTPRRPTRATPRAGWPTPSA